MSGPTEVDQLLARAAAIAAASPRTGPPSGRPLLPTVDRVQATVPRRFQTAALDEFDARLADPLREWASAAPRGRSSVVLLGPAGSGKSRLAAAVCRRVLDRSPDRVRWWTEADLLDACRPGGAGEGGARTVEVLVLDDLGASAPTEWGVAQLLAIVDAQRDYASLDPMKTGSPVYARRLLSLPGRKDGLFWETKPGEPPSPLGPAVAKAQVDGASPDGHYGYYFRLLYSQGAAAPGGAHDYIVNNRMIGGFAAVAWPVRYGVTGVMTFIVSYEGVVYQQDLGPDTAQRAGSLVAFNPDKGWVKADMTPP